MAKLQVDMKSCEALQDALNAARAQLQPPARDPGTGLGVAVAPGHQLNAPEGPVGVMEQIREIEQAMREAGCPIS